MRFWIGIVVAAALAWAVGHRAARTAAPPLPAVAGADVAAARASLGTELGGGAEVRVVAPNAPPRPAAPLPQGSFGAVIDELQRRAAAGDAAAAKELADRYAACRYVREPRSVDEVEHAAKQRAVFADAVIDSVVETAKDHGEAVDESARPIVEDLANAAMSEEIERVRACRGVAPDEDYRLGLAALRRAAELGDAGARVVFWSAVEQSAFIDRVEETVENKRLAARFLQDALHAGDWRALAAVGVALERGTFAEPDPAAAYAYLTAASYAPGASGSDLPFVRALLPATARDQIDARLAALASQLTADERAAATRRGAALYRSCCGG